MALGLLSAPVGHDEFLRWNRLAWERKPLLRDIYYDYYRYIAARLRDSTAAPIVEVGSGWGRIKHVIPTCITTDIMVQPWLDRQENAYALTFPSNSVSNIILFDVWHHLQFPGAALSEFHRALIPGGRLILLEPAISWLGRLIYGLLHYEPLGMRDQIEWVPTPGFNPHNTSYYAAQGNGTRLFWWGENADRLSGWHIREVMPIVSFAYLASGGFSRPQIGGRRFFRFLRFCDRVAARFPGAFASRLLIVLERQGNASHP